MFLGKLAHNVSDIRRFASPDKDLRSKARTGKMWVKGGVGVSVATDLADWNPGAAQSGGGTYIVCYVPFYPSEVFYNILLYSKVLFPQ